MQSNKNKAKEIIQNTNLSGKEKKFLQEIINLSQPSDNFYKKTEDKSSSAISNGELNFTSDLDEADGLSF